MKRPYVVVCPVHDGHEQNSTPSNRSRFTGRKTSLLQAQGDRSRHEDHYDCEHVRIEAIDG